jgi:adenylate kinase family enzyme
MNKVIVLIGYPAAGKTTLANAFIEKHPEFNLHDVYQYIKEYKRPDGTLISEEYTIMAYTDMYRDLDSLEGNAILELGTNHHDFNVQNLKKLEKNNRLFVLLCLLSQDECINREAKRERVIEKEAMLKKFERNFPEVYEKALEKIDISYHYLQMGQVITNQIKTVEEIINE